MKKQLWLYAALLINLNSDLAHAKPQDKQTPDDDSGAVYNDSKKGIGVLPAAALAISTCAELQGINNDLSGEYYLANNVNCAGFDAGDGNGFLPIGNEATPFVGTFDGQEFSISNVLINRPTMDYVGVFGRAGAVDGSDEAIISRVTVKRFNITGRQFVGGLVGQLSYSSAENVHSQGVVTGEAGLGGLVGSNLYSIITNATSSGSVNGDHTGTDPNKIAYGGLVGSNDGGHISCSSSNVNVLGDYKLGGLAGENVGGTISQSFANGTVDGFSEVGGLAGENISGTIANCFATGAVTGEDEVAGLVGLQDADGVNPMIRNSYATGKPTGVSNTGGLLGLMIKGACADNYYDMTTSGVATDGCGAGGRTTAQMQMQNTYPGWDFNNTWQMNGYPDLRCAPTPPPPILDTDNDGIYDDEDNCPLDANTDQADLDKDGLGDVCDNDDDNDTILDPADNCPITPNPDQADLDKDGFGNVCDDDDDNDKVLDPSDNCPLIANPDQADLDKDGLGDVCDDDDDNDKVLDPVDNCPLIANPDQADLDKDGLGDSCDDDVDGDGIVNGQDNCQLIANPDQKDSDADGTGDACDTPESLAVQTTGLIVTRNAQANDDLAQFKMSSMQDLGAAAKAAAATAKANKTPLALTIQFGATGATPIYSYTAIAADLASVAGNRLLFHSADKKVQITCPFSAARCVVNIRKTDLDNAQLDALLTGELTVSLQVGVSTYSNTGTWKQFNSGNGKVTTYRKNK
ncbi:thrombospondin type 3 repeat-containing protein [Candidatus Electronema sp. PJ]|uniref:thrombospondin type 3 repeat-containing protein n=1 Tax=Candidatus Electronema sp. PJ TaxID=3401572 RepID=UPI003AA90209